MYVHYQYGFRVCILIYKLLLIENKIIPKLQLVSTQDIAPFSTLSLQRNCNTDIVVVVHSQRTIRTWQENQRPFGGQEAEVATSDGEV